MNDPGRIEAALARNLRDWRARRGWSLAELARQAGVSKGMLVQIEGCQTNPSIGTLCKLANALGVALPRLVESADDPEIRRVSREDVAWLWRGRGRGSAAGLLAGVDAPMPLELWEWRMGARDAYEATAHPVGTKEIVHVLEGHAAIAVEGTEIRLAPGESAVFQADRPHRYAAAPGCRTRFIMVVLEPLPPGPGPRVERVRSSEAAGRVGRRRRQA